MKIEKNHLLFPCSPKSLNMANFGFIPQDILVKILEFLPARDQIDSGFVCAHWNEVVWCNLRHVTIDASMPFGSRWMEENLRWIDQKFSARSGNRWKENFRLYHEEGSKNMKVWFRNENDPADKEMKLLIPTLCKLTNNVETLNIEEYHLDIESLTELLSSQRRIKTLRINIRNLPAWVKNIYFENIVEAIIRNQETIQVIEINVETKSAELEMPNISIRKIQEIITGKGNLSFPRLKSLTLGSESARAIEALLTKDIFDSLITSSQLEELYCSHIDMLPYIRNGKLDILKKCSLSHGVYELIKHCPYITHLHGFTDNCGDPSSYKQGALKLLSTYGPQLKHFECNLISWEIARAILEECKDIESLVLHFENHCNFEDDIDDSVAIECSLPLFGCLEKLTEIDLRLITSDAEAETVGALIKSCGMNLQSFKIMFEGNESHKIMSAIGTNCKNLKNLKLYIYDSIDETEEEGIRKVRESLDAIIEECQKLRTLDLEVTGLNVSYEGESSLINLLDIYEQIGKKQRYLQHVQLYHLKGIPKAYLVNLIHALPYCNIEF